MSNLTAWDKFRSMVLHMDIKDSMLSLGYDFARQMLKEMDEDHARMERAAIIIEKQNDALNRAFDAFGIGEKARDTATLLTNINNSRRRSDCLSAIERQFFTRTLKDEGGEEFEECALNWGADASQYVEQFKAELERVRYADREEQIPHEPVEQFEQHIRAAGYLRLGAEKKRLLIQFANWLKAKQE